jgi:aryl-alcohol dehydrogenase-like predicted oxidoreductase
MEGMDTTTFGGPTGPQVSTLALGTMMFGTKTDEATSFAVLDRFREAGGTFLDTADCYAFWVDGATGRESEELLGRWLASRGCREEMVIATKLGAQPDPAFGTAAVWRRKAACGGWGPIASRCCSPTSRTSPSRSTRRSAPSRS